MIALLAIAAMVAVLLVPVSALAVGSSEPSRTQTSYTGGEETPPGNGDLDCLRTRDRLYQENCTGDCDGEQLHTRTQTQTRSQVQSHTATEVEAQLGSLDSGAQVKAQVQAGAMGESPGKPDEMPVASTVRAETQAGEGFFGGVFAGLQRFALRLMAWFGIG